MSFVMPVPWELIDRAAEAGANRVDSLSFSHDQGAKLREEASVKALKQALKTAERLAAAAGSLPLVTPGRRWPPTRS